MGTMHASSAVALPEERAFAEKLRGALATRADERPSRILMAVALGTLAAFLSAALWVTVSLATQRVLVLAPLLIGLLVGYSVALGAANRHPAVPVVAGLLSTFALLLGYVLVVHGLGQAGLPALDERPVDVGAALTRLLEHPLEAVLLAAGAMLGARASRTST